MQVTSNLNYWIELKKRELNYQGYNKIENIDIEQYLVNFLWKKQEPQLYIEKVDVVLKITANNIFDYKTLLIQQHPQIKISEINLNDLS